MFWFEKLVSGTKYRGKKTGYSNIANIGRQVEQDSDMLTMF